MTKDEKHYAIQLGVTEASKILIHTMNFADLKNGINSTVVDDATGKTYELKFELQKLNEEKNTRPKEGDMKP